MVSMSAPTAGAARDERRDDGAGSGGHCSIGLVGRLLGWISGALGGLAAYRWLRGRPQVEPDAAPEPVEELRAKLAESRAADEPSPAEPDEPAEAVEERRQRVHDEGRARLDEMKPDD